MTAGYGKLLSLILPAAFLAASLQCMQVEVRAQSGEGQPGKPADSLSGGRPQDVSNPTQGQDESGQTAAGSRAGAWGDQGDGTYVNPVMPADVSDLDVIRVGADFYAFSSTMQYSPGAVILHSRDLVNWTIVGHVVRDLTVLDPELAWNKMNRPARGIWAGALRFHEGKFRVYFGTPDQGIFVSTAEDPAGNWSQPRLLLSAAGWDDPCPFWDDDGQGYLVATHFAAEEPTGTKYNIHLFKLNTEGDQLAKGFDHVIHQSRGSEANKLYKINGVYFHYFSEVTGEGRVPMMERSGSLDGPWEIHQLLHVHPALDKEPNQGGLVELPNGKWFFLSHQGRGDWEGRAGVLLPVTWVDGWPILGKVGSDGVGGMVWKRAMPIAGFPATTLSQSDEFNGPDLKPAWEWRYQPRPDGWSLSAHPGFLRLYASGALRPDDFNAIPDVLTQRSLRTRHSEATVRLDLSGMVDDQEAGIAHFAKTYATLTITQNRGIRRLSFNRDGVRTAGPQVQTRTVYLRSSWTADGQSQFSYSTDGRSFHQAGVPYPLTWGSYRGDRIGLFSVGSQPSSGYVDVDFFHYLVQR